MEFALSNRASEYKNQTWQKWQKQTNSQSYLEILILFAQKLMGQVGETSVRI